MATKIPAEKFRKCQCETHHATSILYQILNKEDGRETKWQQQYGSAHRSKGSKGCSCMDRRVVLKTPEATCRRASEVLLKTLTFIRNLPSFYHMPWDDQLVLIQQNWTPLFVLGMAQERVDFELREISAPSLLKKVLLNQPLTATNELGSSLEASLAEVQKIKNLLWKFWDLDISAKEYAYLKGITLFNSGCHVLKWLPYVQTLQQEAQQALMEFISTMFHRNLGRFAWILQLIASLQDIDADAIEELFFRPILGEGTLNVLLLETLHIKPDWL
ncbi:nuclear receptor subfamily 0 group B member 2-like [Phalacrocorax carbo]|uniref:nuclear receptor subfamily 0 group B member 2-like n=1 Tax=Phalacrocorax carbo TaxID=9209 RepID=UPI00311A03C8